IYGGSLADGTSVAVKKLKRFLPPGEKEFVTEVNTTGSMHHMNLVRLCSYCSEGSHRFALTDGSLRNSPYNNLPINSKECFQGRPITVKADVYSYGMLLLEIVGGRRNLDMSLDAEDFYPGRAFKLYPPNFRILFILRIICPI
ncbi:hypothetical protein RJ641_007619, partial [Dillenia turbinata]